MMIFCIASANQCRMSDLRNQLALTPGSDLHILIAIQITCASDKKRSGNHDIKQPSSGPIDDLQFVMKD
jgi:hypothetical protein